VIAHDDISLLAGDEVVGTKAGKTTSGLDRFFSSWYGKPGPGLAFFTLSLVSTPQRRSFPIRVEQVVRSEAEKAASKRTAARRKQTPCSAKRRPGRPKGSKTTSPTAVTLPPELWRISGMLGALRPWIAGVVAFTSVVLDGHFGHHNARHMARQHHLHVIAKLRRDAARSCPSTGPSVGRGPRRQDGAKVDDDALPVSSLKETRVEGQMQTWVSQRQLLHKECAHPLHVVIIAKTNLRTHARAHVILLSSALDLAYAPLVAYYGLRFQIELNCRDAKQSWGLEDCMHVTPAGVTHAANLSVFMVNMAYSLRTNGHLQDPDDSVLDLKADCRGYKYVEETIKMLPEKPEPIL
jgi:hypothetical protein